MTYTRINGLVELEFSPPLILKNLTSFDLKFRTQLPSIGNRDGIIPKNKSKSLYYDITSDSLISFCLVGYGDFSKPVSVKDVRRAKVEITRRAEYFDDEKTNVFLNVFINSRLANKE